MKSSKSKVNQRRKLLKSVALFSGVASVSGLTASKWVKPLVKTVVLPTHAQTTGFDRFALFVNDFVQIQNQSNGLMIARNVVDTLISPAQAQAEPMGTVEFYMEHLAGDLYRLMVQFITEQIDTITAVRFIDGELKVGEETNISGFGCNSIFGGEGLMTTLTAKIIKVTPGVEAELELFGGEVIVTLPIKPNATPLTEVLCEEVGQ